jgi:predicted peptidase
MRVPSIVLPVFLVFCAGPVVPASDSTDRVAPRQRCSPSPPDVRYTGFPGMDHEAWNAAYGFEKVVNWLFAQRRH